MLEFKVWDLWFGFNDSGFSVQTFQLQSPGFGFSSGVQGLDSVLRVKGIEFRVQGLDSVLRVMGLGFRFQGLSLVLRVKGLGFAPGVSGPQISGHGFAYVAGLISVLSASQPG